MGRETMGWFQRRRHWGGALGMGGSRYKRRVMMQNPALGEMAVLMDNLGHSRGGSP